VTVVDERRAPVTVLVRTDASNLDVIRWTFGSRMVRAPAIETGPMVVEIRGSSEESLAEQLAGFPTTVEVIEPERVRTLLAQIGRALVARYDQSSVGGDG